MFCQKCGKQIPADSKLCPYCGIPIIKASNRQQKEDTKNKFWPFAGYLIIILAIFLIAIDLINDFKSMNFSFDIVSSIIVIGGILFFTYGRKFVKKYCNNNSDIKLIITIAAVTAVYIGIDLVSVPLIIKNNNLVSSSTNTADKSSNKSESTPTNYEGYINKNTFFCNDMETLVRLSDALQHKDNDLVGQLTLEGKIHLIDKDTKVSIIDTGLIDKNAVSIVIEEGRYDLKSGYTFKDWTRKR